MNPLSDKLCKVKYRDNTAVIKKSNTITNYSVVTFNLNQQVLVSARTVVYCGIDYTKYQENSQ